jgi:hypothetical protein
LGCTRGVFRKVKPVETAVPALVVTDMLPLAPLPTTAIRVVESRRARERAATPPKYTRIGDLKYAPLIRTACPLCAEAGLNEEMTGAELVRKPKPLIVAVPPGVLTDRVPLLPLPTTAVMLFALMTEKAAAAVVPNRTLVAPRKWLPLI